MNSLILAGLLTCPTVEIINKTDTWNDMDQKTLQRAKKRCGQLYIKSPCVKKFVKRTETDYSVTCGAMETR